MKLDVTCMRYMSKDEFRVLTAVEVSALRVLCGGLFCTDWSGWGWGWDGGFSSTPPSHL